MSTKQPIAWHEQCLANRISHARRMYDAYIQAQTDYGNARQACLKLEQQIKIAKARGMDGFDAERFGKKK